MSDILTRDDINVTLVDEALWVGSISAAEVPASAWPLLKCMFSETSRRDGDDRPGFFSLTQEEDGLTLIMDDRCQRVFAEAAEAGVANVTYAPHRWRAFEVHLGQLVFEVPGVVCFLSTLMAESHISILNLSTHDRDFVLVAEKDVIPATALIRDRLGGDVDELKAAISDEVQRHQGGRPAGDGRSPPSRGIGAAAELVPAVRASQGADAPGSAGAEGSAVGGLGAELASVGIGEPSGAAAGDAAGGDAASMAERGAAGRTAAEGDAGRPASVARSGVDWRSERLNDEAGCGVSSEAQPPEWYIKVLAPRLVLIRLQLQMMEPSTHALMKRLLFSPRRAAASFWAYTFTEDDVSLIIDEAALRDFPVGAVLGSPTTWRAMKLTGRKIGFDETGVVSSMFAPYRERVPLLNLSTFGANVTLVEERELESALRAFEDAQMTCRIEPDTDELD